MVSYHELSISHVCRANEPQAKHTPLTYKYHVVMCSDPLLLRRPVAHIVERLSLVRCSKRRRERFSDASMPCMGALCAVRRSRTELTGYACQ